MRSLDRAKNHPFVKHFKIQENPKGEFMLGSIKRPFNDLIKYFTGLKRIYTFINFTNLNSFTNFNCINRLFVIEIMAIFDGLKLSKPLQRNNFKPPAIFKNFEVPRCNINLDTQIGQGSFGNVYSAKFKQTMKVAVKELKNPLEKSENSKPIPMHPTKSQKDLLIEEARNMARLQHPKLVQLLGICVETEPFYLIAEFLENGNLKKYLISNGPDKLPNGVLVDMLSQV